MTTRNIEITSDIINLSTAVGLADGKTFSVQIKGAIGASIEIESSTAAAVPAKLVGKTYSVDALGQYLSISKTAGETLYARALGGSILFIYEDG